MKRFHETPVELIIPSLRSLALQCNPSFASRVPWAPPRAPLFTGGDNSGRFFGKSLATESETRVGRVPTREARPTLFPLHLRCICQTDGLAGGCSLSLPRCVAQEHLENRRTGGATSKLRVLQTLSRLVFVYSPFGDKHLPSGSFQMALLLLIQTADLTQRNTIIDSTTFCREQTSVASRCSLSFDTRPFRYRNGQRAGAPSQMLHSSFPARI